MRLFIVLFYLLPLASEDSCESSKNFIKFNKIYEKKENNLTKETFQDYSIGSKNWHQSPLSTFKKYIEGTFLDHLFLKNSQKGKRSFFFNTPLSQSLKNSIQNCDFQPTTDICEKTQVVLHRPTSNLSTLSHSLKHTFTTLKNEITKANANVNIAIKSSRAKAINTQIIQPKVQKFTELFIGSPFWQKDILGSFKTLESIKDLESVFCHKNSYINHDIDLLSYPLRQNLIDNFFLQNVKTTGLESKSAEKIKISIHPSSRAFDVTGFQNNIDLTKNQEKFCFFNNIYKEPIYINKCTPSLIYKEIKYSNYVESLSNQRLNPEINLSMDQKLPLVYKLGYYVNPVDLKSSDTVNNETLVSPLFLAQSVINTINAEQLCQINLKPIQIISSSQTSKPINEKFNQSALECLNPNYILKLHNKQARYHPNELINDIFNPQIVTDTYPSPNYTSFPSQQPCIHIIQNTIDSFYYKYYETENLEYCARTFYAHNQKHNLFSKKQEFNPSQLCLNHPQGYIDNNSNISFITNIKKSHCEIADHYFPKEQLHSIFKNSLDICILEPTTMDQVLVEIPENYHSKNKFTPSLLSNTFSYDYNYHYINNINTLSKPLYLSDYNHDKLFLEQASIKNNLIGYNFLEQLFIHAFDQDQTVNELPSSFYHFEALANELCNPIIDTENSIKMEYLEQDDSFINQDHIQAKEFIFKLDELKTSYQNEVSANISLNHKLHDKNTILNLHAVNSAKNESELLDVLQKDPTNNITSLSNDFKSQVYVIPNMNDENFLFKIKMSSEIKKSPIKHIIYFVLDHTQEMKNSEFYAYKNVINKSIEKLKKHKTFFNIITVGNNVYKLHSKNLKPTRASIQLAHQFITKVNLSNHGNPLKIFDVIQKLKHDCSEKNEMCTVILLSSLKPFEKFTKFKQPLQRIAQIQNNNFQLFGLYYGQKNNASGINLLARLNRGTLISSTNAKGLYKKSKDLMTKISRPFITDIRLTMADPTVKNVNFAYCSDYTPIIHSQKPFFIYGKINTLENVKFILQGKQGSKWINIVQNIDFSEAKIAKGTLEKRLALENSLFWYAKFFQEPHPQYLKIAKDAQKPFDLPLP